MMMTDKEAIRRKLDTLDAAAVENLKKHRQTAAECCVFLSRAIRAAEARNENPAEVLPDGHAFTEYGLRGVAINSAVSGYVEKWPQYFKTTDKGGDLVEYIVDDLNALICELSVSSEERLPTVAEWLKQYDGSADIDVYDDYVSELGIAYCGAQVTEEGKKHFADALSLLIEEERKPGEVPTAWVHVTTGKELKAAIEFFNAAAGYCSDENYKKWFYEYDEGENSDGRN